jgi:hypothetical protein
MVTVAGQQPGAVRTYHQGLERRGPVAFAAALDFAEEISDSAPVNPDLMQ